MGFDELRPKRAQEYDTWGLIGSRHSAPEPKAEPSLTDIIGGLAEQARTTLAAHEEDLEEGSPCPGCGHRLSWITRNACHPSQSVQLGCEGCDKRFGDRFP